MSPHFIITGIIFLFSFLIASALSGYAHAQDENITTFGTKNDSTINEFKATISITNDGNENESGIIELTFNNNSSMSNSTNQMSFPKNKTTVVPLEFTSKQSPIENYTAELMYGDDESIIVEGLINKSASMEHIKFFLDPYSTVKVNITNEQSVNLTGYLQVTIDNTNLEKQIFNPFFPTITPKNSTSIPVEFDSRYVPPGTAYTVKFWINNEGNPLISQGKFDPANDSRDAKIVVK